MKALQNSGDMRDITPHNDQTNDLLTTLHYKQQALMANVEKIQNELQLMQAQKASRLEDSLYSPKLFDHYQKVANLLARSSMVPQQYVGKPADIFVAMAMGYQLGFPVEQALQDIAVIRGRPALWGDGLLSLAISHPDCEYINEDEIIEKGHVVGYRCTVKRKDHPEHVKTFMLQDAKQAGLLGSNVWAKYTSRMLQMRARGFAIRDKFPDALRGIRIAEIEQDDAQYIDGYTASPQGQTQTERVKAFLTGDKHDQMDQENLANSETDGVDIQSQSSEGTHSVADSGLPQSASESTIESAPVTDEQKGKIEILIAEKSFGDERLQKALNFYKVDSIESMSKIMADNFIVKLEKL